MHLTFAPPSSAAWPASQSCVVWCECFRAQRNYFELTLISIGYAWLLAVMPYGVALASILFGGWLVGVVVTATHQSEQITTKEASPVYNFVRHQFDSTRNADTTGTGLMHFLWGGMQFQLEHHLFPTLVTHILSGPVPCPVSAAHSPLSCSNEQPRYRNGEVAKRTQQWAKENGLEYRSESVWAIWKRTLSTMQHYGTTPAL
jgi:hypothetical protein